MELKSNPQIVCDSSMVTRKPHSMASVHEWRNFMSSNPSDIFKDAQSRRFRKQVDSDEEKDLLCKQIFKEVEKLGVSQMPWKERKAVENQKVLALGGKPLKNYRVPISLGKCIKAKRERMEQEKSINEEILLCRPTKRAKNTDRKRIPEDHGLMASEGIFKHGVLHVKPLKTRDEKSDEGIHRMGKGKKKNKSKKKKHKGKRRH